MTENTNYDYSTELFDVRQQITISLTKATGSNIPVFGNRCDKRLDAG